MTPDIADIIAGELKVSRGTAYDLMREALKQTEQPAVQDERYNALLDDYRAVLDTLDEMQPAAWVGLTADEMLEALVSVDPATKRLPIGFTRFAQAIEAKLKEKNT